MWNALKNAFKIPELRDRILFTFLALAVFRLGVYIPIPGLISKPGLRTSVLYLQVEPEASSASSMFSPVEPLSSFQYS